MVSVSKTKLQISRVVIDDVYIHPQLQNFKYDDPENTWSFGVDVIRKTHDKTDHITLEAYLDYNGAQEKEMLGSVSVNTYVEMKVLKEHEVDEELWQYLMNTAINHCRAAFAYHTRNTLLQGHLIKVMTKEQLNVDLNKKIKDIWGSK